MRKRLDGNYELDDNEHDLQWDARADDFFALEEQLDAAVKDAYARFFGLKNVGADETFLADPTAIECQHIYLPRGDLTLDDCPSNKIVTLQEWPSTITEVDTGPPMLAGNKQICYGCRII